MKIELKSILYPTDYSDLSLKAMPYAISFAGAYKAKLHCLHVIDEAYQYWMSIGPESVPIAPPMEDLTEISDKQMADFVQKHFGDLSQPVVTATRIGRPFCEICEYAKEEKIDLIVIATHGRSGLSHAFLGSTAEKVVRKAPCPVLAVQDPAQGFVKP